MLRRARYGLLLPLALIPIAAGCGNSEPSQKTPSPTNTTAEGRREAALALQAAKDYEAAHPNYQAIAPQK